MCIVWQGPPSFFCLWKFCIPSNICWKVYSCTERLWYLCWKLFGIDVLFCFGVLNSIHKSMSICCYACTKLFRLLYLNFEIEKYVASNLFFFSNLFWLFWAASNYIWVWDLTFLFLQKKLLELLGIALNYRLFGVTAILTVLGF